jgi:fatty acid desaturase
VCIANISTQERRKRLMMGVVTFAVSLVILVILMATGVSRWWRLPLFLLFVGAASGFFQWRDHTCVGLASRESRKLVDTVVHIDDAAELAQVRRQAQRVQIKSVLAAIPLTLIALALPLL